MSLYAIFDKIAQTITYNYPLVFGNNTAIRANTNDSATSPAYTWGTQTNMGMYHAATNVIGFSTLGLERMRIDGSGYVGIGTNEAKGLLYVRGTAQSLAVTSAGNVGVGTTNPITGYSLHSFGYSLLHMPVIVMEERYTNSPFSIVYCDGKPDSTTAQSSVNGARTWRIRRLTNIIYPATGDAIRNQIVTGFVIGDNGYFELTPGTYHISAEASGAGCGRHRIALVEASGSTLPEPTVGTFRLLGTCEYSHPVFAVEIKDLINNTENTVTNLCTSKSTISGILQVTSPITRFRIQHYTDQPDNVGVFGIPAASIIQDVHTRVIITRYQ